MTHNMCSAACAGRMLEILEGCLAAREVLMETLETMCSLLPDFAEGGSPSLPGMLDDIGRRLEGCRLALHRCRLGWPKAWPDHGIGR